MTPQMLSVNLFVGMLFVLVWGILSYVASSQAEFKSFFFGGLANFVFFIGGVLANYFSDLIKPAVSPTMQAVEPVVQQNSFGVMVALNIALATICAIVLTNLFAEGFTNALGRLERLEMISFQPDGYRDIQIYAGGSFGILCFLSAWLYGLYLGSMRPETTYLTVLAGVTISLGVQGVLYLIFGIFFDSQIFQILKVSTPPVLDTYDPLLKRIFSFGITFSAVIFGILAWTTLFWLSIKLGRLAWAIPFD